VEVFLKYFKVLILVLLQDSNEYCYLFYFLWTEFPFPKPDMITRLEGEEESHNSDEWQLRGTVTGTMSNPIQHPSWEEHLEADFQFPCTFCRVFRSEGQRLWANHMTLDNFLHLSGPPFLHWLLVVLNKACCVTLYVDKAKRHLYGVWSSVHPGECGHIGSTSASVN
jgi:hypothetical protein